MDQLFVGTALDVGKQHLNLAMANRHGLVAGATGTGKTVTLQILTEGFSAAGVPVFCADVKGDLSGMAAEGGGEDFLVKRARTIGFEGYGPERLPVTFWDIFGQKGHPVRTTISEFGPVLLARLLRCNDTQEGILQIAFALADELGLLLLDMKDLEAVLQTMRTERKQLEHRYGLISPNSLGAVQRRVFALKQAGGGTLFGEPALDLADLMRVLPTGQGVVNVLHAVELIRQPKLYATFLLWLLSELFETLPEVGDPDRPCLVLFFDEAHLLFNDAPKVLIEKVEQVVRLIRSKGVGVFFVTQSPTDVPSSVLGQLGNRIQHALRAFTPADQRAVKTAADTFRPNPALDTRQVITELGVGEALVSLLDQKGRPGIVQRTLIRPPSSRLGPLTPDERAQVRSRSIVGTRYDTPLDRKSAFEELKVRAEKRAWETAKREAAEKAAKEAQRQQKRRDGRRTSFLSKVATNVSSTLARQLGRSLVRGILGSLR